jgi:hypothetical protein
MYALSDERRAIDSGAVAHRIPESFLAYKPRGVPAFANRALSRPRVRCGIYGEHLNCPLEKPPLRRPTSIRS